MIDRLAIYTKWISIIYGLPLHSKSLWENPKDSPVLFPHTALPSPNRTSHSFSTIALDLRVEGITLRVSNTDFALLALHPYSCTFSLLILLKKFFFSILSTLTNEGLSFFTHPSDRLLSIKEYV